eukprot:CAMPEP_0113823788 /NCGR_PEP_ID=MMETSP0328-20130328/2918_1 /TAXON_ID=39455 /ORGANISM="Alexandrium minutum" /LENGTH=113 /DNA_ID=CAMNT_0000791729 /DNA_START=48 /DNA_END=389 /DNA_ORIENTATION=- /assembly_acc=CAM_ASM_000350
MSPLDPAFAAVNASNATSVDAIAERATGGGVATHQVVLFVIASLVLILFLSFALCCICSVCCVVRRGVPETVRPKIETAVSKLVAKGFFPELNEDVTAERRASARPAEAGGGA